MRRAPDVDALLEALAAGRPIDWNAAEAAASGDAARSLIRQFRVVAGIAELHASVPPAALPDAMAGSPAATGGREPTGRWGPLELLEKVGQGTYGEVFRAWDPKLDREVALKLLWPSRTTHRAASTVVEEGRLLARVRHPNVVTIYGADAHDGRVGLWMEFIEGQTLESLLRTSGPLSAAEAGAIGVAVCNALAAVHDAGIVHGDVKAQNVMRSSDGRLVVTDFGTGRELEPLRESDVPTPTSSASASGERLAGTPLYLAPEVLERRPPTPHSDIYSIGVLLYRLVSCRYPVTGASLEEVREIHRSGRRVALQDARSGIDRRFVEIVHRAIDPVPDRRFGSAHACAAALVALEGRPQRGRVWRAAAMFATIIAVLGAAGLWYQRARSTAGSDANRLDTVLVVPFENATGDAGFDEGLALALERELVAAGSVTVVSRGRLEDTLTLMEKPPDTRLDASLAREVCLRDGGIGAYVTGRAEPGSGGIVLTAALHDLETDRVSTAVREIVRDAADAPRGMRLLAAGIRRTLGQSAKEVEQATQRLERVTTPSLRALRLYSASYELGQRREWPAALVMVEDALREDPTFAAAQIWKAWCIRNSSPLIPPPPSDTFMPAAERALALADTASDWERYWIRGSYHSLKNEYEAALPHYHALLRIVPDHFWALNNLQTSLRRLGRWQEALPLALQAADARPNSVQQQATATMLLLMEGAVERAEPCAARLRQLTRQGRHVLDLGVESAWLLPSERAWLAGDTSRALHELDQLGSGPALEPADRDAFQHAVFETYLQMGRLDDARRVALRFASPRWQHVRLALVAHFAGEPNRVTQELEQADVSQQLDPLVSDSVMEAIRLRELLYSAVWLHLQHGRPGDAGRVARNIEPPPRTPRWVAPHLAGLRSLALGRPEEAIQRFSEFPVTGPSGSYDMEQVDSDAYLRHVAALADALARTGQRDRAIDTLRHALRVRPWAHPRDGGVFRMSAQRQLAALLREARRHEEADVLDAEARRLLAAADPTFILARGL